MLLFMCSLGDIMNAALPAYFRIASETQVVIHPQFDGELDDLTNDEIKLLDLSLHIKLTLKEILNFLIQNRFLNLLTI